MQTIYEAVGGREGLLKLASAWHVRVMDDEVVSHAFSHCYHPQHTERPHEEMDQRAIACFDQALEDIGPARDARLFRVLHDYFAWATTGMMARYHRSADDVPSGLQIPKWSWHGLVQGT